MLKHSKPVTSSTRFLVQVDTKKYITAGSYTITLNTTTNKGCKDTTSKVVIVNPQLSPNFTLNADSQCYKGNNFKFTNTTTGGSALNSYFWDLGDAKFFDTLPNLKFKPNR
jgi:hypothetical protein